MSGPFDNLCLLIDLDGYHLSKKFQVRELGFRSWCGDSGSHFFRPSIPYEALNVKERKTVQHVNTSLIGLPFHPGPSENPVHFQRVLKPIVKQLYAEFRTDVRGVVGFKGGSIERALLKECGIPHQDIEQWGCPRFDQLPTPDNKGCGCHKNIKGVHCPQIECEAFWNWTRLLFENCKSDM